MDIIQQHNEMVARLAKPGAAILATLTPDDCNLIHMGGCLMGEAAELYEALAAWKRDGIKANENLIEEFGDFEFYMVAVNKIVGRNRHLKASPPATHPCDHGVWLMRYSGDFWDVVKRTVVYRKPMDVDKARLMLEAIESELNALHTWFGFTLQQILEANYTKLADKDKGRYKSGSYSDEQAQLRHDKAGA